MITEPGHIKIYFKLEQDEEGYPPVDWETLWAAPKGDDLYVLDNTPFYAQGISSGDTVSATSINDRLEFSALIAPGGHSTIRVVVFEETLVSTLRTALVELGCSTELSNIPTFFSTDVPPTVDYSKVMKLLVFHATSGQIDYEESSFQH